jgi:hypothetical protein
LAGVAVQREEGLRHLGRRGAGFFAAAAHPPLAVAAQAVRIDDEDPAGVMPRGAAQPAEGALQVLGLGHGMAGRQLMDADVGREERQAVGQGEALLGQGPFGAEAGGA